MKEKILIVDDEPDILITLKKILQDEGFLITCISNGKEAIDFFKADSFDLVITDLKMPGIDGLEVLRQIKKVNANTEVIILTGYGTIENAIEALKNDGAYDFITKPLEDIDQLIITVNKALERRSLSLDRISLIDKLKKTNKALQTEIQKHIETTKELQKAKKSLNNSIKTLETRVQERTKQLTRINKELTQKSNELEELNTALKVLLKKREQDQKVMGENIIENVQILIKPTLEKLKKSVQDSTEEMYIEILEKNLQEIVSPFTSNLASSFFKLSPSEIEIANLVKSGKTSKEIASMLNVSVGTIEVHREHIRKKLGIQHSKKNLRSFLLSINNKNQ